MSQWWQFHLNICVFVDQICFIRLIDWLKQKEKDLILDIFLLLFHLEFYLDRLKRMKTCAIIWKIKNANTLHMVIIQFISDWKLSSFQIYQFFRMFYYYMNLIKPSYFFYKPLWAIHCNASRLIKIQLIKEFFHRNADWEMNKHWIDGHCCWNQNKPWEC